MVFFSMSWNPSPYPVIEHSLADAHAAIKARIQPVGHEQIAAAQGLERVTAASFQAPWPKPLYDQSTRDGFALAAAPATVENERAMYQLVGEIAAGSRDHVELAAGSGVRIMTGAMVPTGCVRVVPFEECVDHGDRVEISLSVLQSRQLYICRRGSEVREGKVLVASGTRLQPHHLLMLVENGCREIMVRKKPAVAVLCTGSELIDAGEMLHPGQKISGNGILLSSLLYMEGAHCVWSGTVEDQLEIIEQQVRDVLDAGADMVLTTGGMGPGKFDLMEQVFAGLGGTVVYNRLRVRPGKFTLLGMIGRIPFFALPGPPPAVRILFHELVVPALYQLQGRRDALDRLVPAELLHTLSVKQTGHLNLKSGVVQVQENGLAVHPAGRMEPMNAIIHLEGDRLAAEYGEQVMVRLVGPFI
jgi:molybdopterin molybdotransferase